MKKIILALLVMGLLFGWTNQAWAPTATATATLSATVPSVLTLSLYKETNSVGATAGAVKFDLLDSQDTDSPYKDGGYMYAPYLGKGKVNWHVAKITANGTATLSLKVDAVLTGIDKSKLKVWFGGFWLPGEEQVGTNPPSKGGVSTVWEAMGSSKSTTGPFTGQCPLNYQLNVAAIAGSTTAYTGTITYTLTQ